MQLKCDPSASSTLIYIKIRCAPSADPGVARAAAATSREQLPAVPRTLYLIKIKDPALSSVIFALCFRRSSSSAVP